LKIVAERLRAARQAKKLSQMEVISLTSIHNKTLSGYENDVSDPSLETLTKLATLYSVKTDWLLGRTDPLMDGQCVGPTYPATVALSRTDNPEDNLPEEALKELENFRAYSRQKYKKPG